MWIRRNTLENKLAEAFGFEFCTLFDTARSALAATGFDAIPIPSNVCPALGKLLPRAPRFPVNPKTGMADVRVQLYGYRVERQDIQCYLDLDPLMTGFLRKPCARNAVISFGPKKMLDAGGGGALLSNEPFKGKTYFPEGLRKRVEWVFKHFAGDVEVRRSKIDEWDRYLGDSCVRIPQEQIMPWRVMRRIPEKRDAVVKALRDAAIPVGTNYPPLPGVTDPGAIEWGKTVINFFPDWHDIAGACEIIKRTIAA